MEEEARMHTMLACEMTLFTFFPQRPSAGPGCPFTPHLVVCVLRVSRAKWRGHPPPPLVLAPPHALCKESPSFQRPCDGRP